MPDWMLIILALLFSVITLSSLSARVFGWGGLLLLATIGLWTWFGIAVNCDWGPAIGGFDQRIAEFKHVDGSVTQYPEGLDPEKGAENTLHDRFYPPGTVMHTEIYGPWVCGVRWSTHQKRVFVLPK